MGICDGTNLCCNMDLFFRRTWWCENKPTWGELKTYARWGANIGVLSLQTKMVSSATALERAGFQKPKHVNIWTRRCTRLYLRYSNLRMYGMPMVVMVIVVLSMKIMKHGDFHELWSLPGSFWPAFAWRRCWFWFLTSWRKSPFNEAALGCKHREKVLSMDNKIQNPWSIYDYQLWLATMVAPHKIHPMIHHFGGFHGFFARFPVENDHRSLEMPKTGCYHW